MVRPRYNGCRIIPGVRAVGRHHPSAVRLLAVLVAIAAALPVLHASADDQRVSGPYTITATFESTPVYEERLNALIIHVTRDGQPVSGLETTLRLRVGEPNQATETMDLAPVAGQPGVYRVPLMFPRASHFFMDLFGTTDGQQITEQFLTGQNGLAAVVDQPDAYPRGADWIVAITFGFYLVGLAWLTGRAALAWLRRRSQRRPAAPSV